TNWHQQILNYANTHVTDPSNTYPYYEPGTPAFDSAFAAITSRESLSKGGSRFYDHSALYHAQGEYKINVSFMDVKAAVYNADSSALKSSFLRKAGAGFINFFNGMEITLGASGRMYRPDSHGTIFSDSIYYVRDTIYNSDNSINRIDSTEKRNKITNTEYGVYFGIGKKILREKLNLNITTRLDKNENFDYLFSPAVSGVYTVNDNHIIRATFSSAIRNPTLTDQYLYYPVGRALLVGNINGYDSIATIESLISLFNTGNEDSLKYFSVSAVQPEKVKTIEFGYRATLFQHLYMDLNYYFSFYDDFIGYRIGAQVPIVILSSLFGVDTVPDYNNIKVLRIASNAKEQVTTQGASIGLNYLFAKFFSVNGNYSFNRLNKESDDPLVPAYNTPKHKFNVGISGRDIITQKIKNWGFNINYKWVQGFLFEGSPQFTGKIDTYDLVDFQVNKKFPEQHTTFKLGVQNLLNNKHYEVYGGPLVGRLAYFQVNVEIN
ncbi:MAG: TonB-dependent receptor, partial [Bacteroidota bacterium]